MKRTVRVLVSASALLLFAALVHWCFTERMEGKKKGTDNGELLEVSWVQTHERAEGCFYFRFKKRPPGDDGAAPMYVFDCEFRNESGELVSCENVPVGEVQWRKLEAEINGLELPEYQLPDSYLLDAADSRIEISWEKNGRSDRKQYDGGHESVFLEAVKKLAEEIVP